ncbi:MAG: YbaN family protein [Candidatus Marinimicrobia bacterium]|nr:YbaN family protein [Candidatus Neomarinimicrobiota bacterium]
MPPAQHKTNSSQEIKTIQNPIVRTILIVVGSISLILGLIGVLLPILPTTPFIILAAACFARSSQKFYDLLYGNRFFGKILRDYRDKKGLALKYKIYILAMLWITLSSSAIFIVNVLWLRIFLFAVAIAVSIHILRFKTLKTD